MSQNIKAKNLPQRCGFKAVLRRGRTKALLKSHLQTHRSPPFLNQNPSVMNNLNCQLDYICNKLKLLNYICNQLKLQWLVMPVRDFLNWITWGRKVHPKSGTYLLVAAQVKKEAFAFCLFALTLADKSPSLSLKQSLLVSEPTSSRSSSRSKTSKFPDWDCWDIRDIQPKGINNY